MKSFKKIVSGILSAAIILSFAYTAPASYVSAYSSDEATVSRSLGGLEHGELITINDADVTINASGELSRSSLRKSSKAYNYSSGRFSTYYIYNVLDDAQRRLWDDLDALCYKAMTTAVDYSLETENNETFGVLDSVGFEGLSMTEAQYIAILFRYCNPQYFFLDVSPWTTSGVNDISFCIYEAFASGSARLAAVSEFESKASSVLSGAASYSTDEEKVRYFQQAICDMTKYDITANDTAFQTCDNPYHQSAYSIFCCGSSVCAGYSMALEYLCNGADIDCYTVTSREHQWNRVRLEDNWYNIDTTWADDDTTGQVDYSFYLRSDNAYRGLDSGYMRGAHTAEALWRNLAARCTLDCGSTKDEPGALPSITQSASDPKIIYNGTSCYISCDTEGAYIFYTIDGSDPSEAASKAYLYENAFTVTSGSEVKAIAVCDGYLDSDTEEDAITLKKPKVSSAKNIKTQKIKIKLSGLGKASGYQIAYSTNKSFSSGTVKTLGTKTTYTTGKLKKGKTYYVRVRTYITCNGQRLYSSWSSLKTVKITK